MTGRNTTRSHATSPPHQFGFLTTEMRSPERNSSKRNGPVPIAAAPELKSTDAVASRAGVLCDDRGHGEVLGHGRVRAVGADAHRQVVDLLPGSCRPSRGVKAGLAGAPSMPGAEPIEGEDHVVGGEGLAVVPGHALAQLELPRRVVDRGPRHGEGPGSAGRPNRGSPASRRCAPAPAGRPRAASSADRASFASERTPMVRTSCAATDADASHRGGHDQTG